jgi:hypothetical protein
MAVHQLRKEIHEVKIPSEYNIKLANFLAVDVKTQGLMEEIHKPMRCLDFAGKIVL